MMCVRCESEMVKVGVMEMNAGNSRAWAEAYVCPTNQCDYAVRNSSGKVAHKNDLALNPRIPLHMQIQGATRFRDQRQEAEKDAQT